MKYYRAYTQKGFNEEKFYIEDENQIDLIVKAENREEAEKIFIENIYETSLYSDAITKEWLVKNPLTVEELTGNHYYYETELSYIGRKLIKYLDEEFFEYKVSINDDIYKFLIYIYSDEDKEDLETEINILHLELNDLNQ